jgi:hypothetical protein
MRILTGVWCSLVHVEYFGGEGLDESQALLW